MQEPGCLAAVRVRDGRCVVLVPRLPQEYAVWMGRLRAADEFKSKYAVEQVNYVDEVSGHSATPRARQGRTAAKGK